MGPTGGSLEVVAALGRVPAFVDVPERALADLADQGVVHDIRANTYLWHRGDAAASACVLVAGKVEISSIYGDGQRELHAIVLPPALFGELGVISGGVRTATATALEDGRMLAIPAPRFLGFLECTPSAALGLLGAVTARVLEHEGLVEDLLWLDLRGRVAKRLLELAGDEGRTPELTQADLAALAGGRRENVARVLAELQKRGTINRSGKSYELIDPGHLARLAGLDDG